MSQSVSTSASQLRWRCRRGMLELDLLLTTFMEMEYNNLPKEDVELFSILLDYEDQHLLDLLLGKTESSDAAISSLVVRIRHTCCDKYNRIDAI